MRIEPHYVVKNILHILMLQSASVIARAHSFPRKNVTNSEANLVNSAVHRGKADEIPLLTADSQLNFRGLIKS